MFARIASDINDNGKINKTFFLYYFFFIIRIVGPVYSWQPTTKILKKNQRDCLWDRGTDDRRK